MSDDGDRQSERKKTYFMAPLRIDTSGWSKKEYRESLRRLLVKAMTVGSRALY